MGDVEMASDVKAETKEEEPMEQQVCLVFIRFDNFRFSLMEEEEIPATRPTLKTKSTSSVLQKKLLQSWPRM